MKPTYEFAMHVAAKDKKTVVLEAAPEELPMLRKMLQAGIQQIETVSVVTTNSVSESAIRDFIERIPPASETGAAPGRFRLSNDEFFDLSCVLGVVGTLDPEDHFPDLHKSYPDDAVLGAFVDHVDEIYKEACGREPFPRPSKTR